ncbi:MAG TPA: hypothetical protein VFB63_08275 [Bryobacteraceae bacterium]|nr:hypothetical protein [Bryobacteraceae bacterium]
MALRPKPRDLQGDWCINADPGEERPVTDLTGLSNREILALYALLMETMRERGLVRSANGPAADIAEGLVAKAFLLTLNTASTAGYDGVDPSGSKIEVKCRRLTRRNPSRQLGAIRNLEDAHFDSLAGVLFNEDFSVFRAALIPFHIVKEQATFVAHTNAWKFVLRDTVWSLPGVQDITERLRQVQH